MSYQKIKGMMSDGVTPRFVQVDAEGRVVLAPSKLKEITVTKAIAAASAEEANDVMSEHVTAGTPWIFENVTATTNGGAWIVAAHAISETESITPNLTLFLFNGYPRGLSLIHI